MAWRLALWSSIMSLLDQLEVISRVFNTNPVNHNWASRCEGVAFIFTSSSDCIGLWKHTILSFIKWCFSLELGLGGFKPLFMELWFQSKWLSGLFTLAVLLVNTGYEFSSALKYKVTCKLELEFEKKPISCTSSPFFIFQSRVVADDLKDDLPRNVFK